MNSVELVRKLGAALQQEPEYIRYRLAKQRNDEDDELQDLLTRFENVRLRLNAETVKDHPDRDMVSSLNEELRRLYAETMVNPNMIEYREAKSAWDEKYRYITGILELCAGGEDPAVCEPTPQCGAGGCAGCSGCR